MALGTSGERHPWPIRRFPAPRASANFQYGSLPGSTPNYWKQVTEQRWKDASFNLKKFGDSYPTRRKVEAGLVDAAIAAAPASPAAAAK